MNKWTKALHLKGNIQLGVCPPYTFLTGLALEVNKRTRAVDHVSRLWNKRIDYVLKMMSLYD